MTNAPPSASEGAAPAATDTAPDDAAVPSKNSSASVAIPPRPASPPVLKTPEGSPVRYRIDPRDIPPSKVARRLHLKVAEFREKLPELIARGFPRPDPTTGNFYLPAIDKWMADRNMLDSGSPNNSNSISDRIARF